MYVLCVDDWTVKSMRCIYKLLQFLGDLRPTDPLSYTTLPNENSCRCHSGL